MKNGQSAQIVFGKSYTNDNTPQNSSKKNLSQTPAPVSKQGSDDLSFKKQAIHDVYKQYA